MTAGKQTVAGAYAKIESHERECTLRYEALGGAIGDVKGETPRDAGHHRGQPDRVAGWAALRICAAGHRGGSSSSGRASPSDRRTCLGRPCHFKALAGRN